MRFYSSILVKVLVIQCLALACAAQDFDFFYFTQMWPVSTCDVKPPPGKKPRCCYPKTGRPKEDFTIHGLWPNYNNGSYPKNCDKSNPFDASQISEELKRSLEQEWPTLSCPSADGLKFWGHEWSKHGTCSESVYNQTEYFQAGLKLKKEANLLEVLVRAGIIPEDGLFYTAKALSEAIELELGVTPYIQCNVDGHGNSQLFQVVLCVNKIGYFTICPIFPSGERGCDDSRIEFPSFSYGDAINSI